MKNFQKLQKSTSRNAKQQRKKIDCHYSKVRKNKFEIVDTDEVAFVMIGTNKTDVRRSLDGIRQRRQKFVCLNDNMNHSNPHSVEVVKVIQEFYKSFLPLPSSFELPPNKTNRYLYIEDLMKAREEIEGRKRTIYILVGVVCVCLFCLARSCVYEDGRRPSGRPNTRERLLKASQL